MFAVYLVKALFRLFLYVCTYIDRQLNHLCRYSVQITHNLNSTPVSHACDMHVQKQKHVWHQTTQSAFIPICNELKSVIRPYKESATSKTTSCIQLEKSKHCHHCLQVSKESLFTGVDDWTGLLH